MNASSLIDIAEPSSQRTSRLVPFGRWPVFLLLCGYLIFSHGCHAHDVDDELCVPVRHEPIRKMDLGERGRVSSSSATLGAFTRSCSPGVVSAALPSAAPWRTT